MASLALTDAIRELGLSPAITWPNDVLLQGRKVAGTLAEGSAEDDRLEYVILGVGVNVNVERETLRDGLGKAAQSATSRREALGHPIDRNALHGRVPRLPLSLVGDGVGIRASAPTPWTLR
jgi:BirA family biotin operon repressor/biotin-[acetyl-CoA-carboxylase] ligase